MTKTIYGEGEFMKPFKLFIIFLIVLAIFITPLGCTSEPKPVADEPIEQTKREQDQKEVNDYLNELREWNEYLAEYANDVFPLEKELLALEDKRIEASKAGDSKKADSYMEVEADKCEEVLEAWYAIYVPEIAKDFHNYSTNSCIKHKQWLSYMVESGRELEAGILDFDATKAQNLFDESDHLSAQADQELERIKRQLEQKAKELDL